MKKAILFSFILGILNCVSAQTPLAPPLPGGTTYFKGMVVSQTGVGIIGCTYQQYILADGSGCSGGSGQQASVFITDPPYNAKCDGSTDDTAAIQAAMNSGAAIVEFPVSSEDSTFQCNTNSTLNWPFSLVAVNGNASILAYQGTGTAIDFSQVYQANWPVINLIDIELDSPTGSPVGLGGTANFTLNQLNFTSENGNALAIDINGEVDAYLNGVYGDIPMILGAAITSDHLEFNCNNNDQTGLTIPASYISTFNGLSIAGCKYAVDLGPNGAPTQQTVTINSGDFDTIATAIFNIEQPSTNLLFGSVQYNHSTGEVPLFSNANFQGNLQAYDFATQLTTTYQTSNALQFGSSTRYAASSFPVETTYSDNEYDANLFLLGADSFSSGGFETRIALSGYEPCAEPCTPLQDNTNLGSIIYEGTIDPSTGLTSDQDYRLSVPNNIGGNAQLEIDDLGNVGIGGAGMTGGGDADNGDLFVDAGVGAYEKYKYNAANLTHTGNCLEDNAGDIIDSGSPCSGGSSAVSLGTCTGGTISGTAAAFKVTGITSGTSSCVVNFSPSLSFGVCTAIGNAAASTMNATSLSTSSVTFNFSSINTAVYAMCQ